MCEDTVAPGRTFGMSDGIVVLERKRLRVRPTTEPADQGVSAERSGVLSAVEVSRMEDGKIDPVTRRSFLGKAGLVTLSTASLAAAGAAESGASETHSSKNRHTQSPTYYAMQRSVQEWSFTSGKAYADPFNQVELDVIFKDADGQESRMPAFWAGEQTWNVRFSAAKPGKYTFRTIASDTANPDLHDQTGDIVVSEYTGSNTLLKHGPIRVASDRSSF